jgi:hypothetical protein
VAKIGVVAEKPSNPDSFSPEIRTALDAGMADGSKAINDQAAKTASAEDLVGTREYLDYLSRAVGAKLGIYGNPKEEAYYFKFTEDVAHQPGLLLRVQVVKIAEELVEAVYRREHVVAVAEVVLAELSGGVTQRFEQLSECRIFLLQTFRRARQADLGESGADRRLACNERGAAGGAALLAVPVGEERALASDAVNIRRFVTHHSQVVGANVERADVIAPDNEDVGFLFLGARGGCHERQSKHPDDRLSCGSAFHFRSSPSFSMCYRN